MTLNRTALPQTAGFPANGRKQGVSGRQAGANGRKATQNAIKNRKNPINSTHCK
jgi:hypothetical protein